MRLDLELIERDLAPSRSKAQELIKNNYIFVNDKLISKPSFEIKETDDIKIKENKILFRFWKLILRLFFFIS